MSICTTLQLIHVAKDAYIDSAIKLTFVHPIRVVIFTVHQAQAMATVANPEPEHLFRKADMELREQATSDPRFRSVVTTRSSQSKD